MESVHVQTTNPLSRAHRVFSPLAPFTALLSRLTGTLADDHANIAARYGGHAWCDATEYEIGNSITSGKRASRF